MNGIFEFLSNIDEAKLIIIGGMTLLTIIPLAILLRPAIREAIKILRHFIDKDYKN
ncbi:holin, BlyA family-containing protein (plasmid) [Candidatus Borreliella tachyglossi]|uniref:Holin, BlyA family-containing protein n=1 Tax=Candidatus Borreliella tachyglossi TaxID=1964448 RepID=A0A2S1LYF5_9SPIR|nr:BlyA family holin [Candidatus Borreliella tachyglossi]AWG43316.1 holin, BlyA family-containing protein [Candidatus Borreliella tachyglossi]